MPGSLVGQRRALINSGNWFPSLLPDLALWLSGSRSPMTFVNTAYNCTGVVSQTGTTLTGVASAFLSEVKVGDLITAVGILETVVSIASDTSLTLSGSLSSGAGLTYTITPTAGVSDRVSQWNDLSKNGNHATMGTSSIRPQVKYAQLNGKNVLGFDGADDYFASALTFGNPWTIVAIMKWAANQLNDAGVIHSSNNGLFMTTTAYAALVNDVQAEISSAVTQGVFHSIVYTQPSVTANEALLYLNDVDVTTPAADSGFSLSTNNIFKGFADRVAKADLAELIVVNRSITATERQLLKGFRQKEWGF